MVGTGPKEDEARGARRVSLVPTRQLDPPALTHTITMSWFSTTDPNAPNLHPVQLAFGQEALFGPLVQQDTEWLCAGGFVTETQVFYATMKDGGLVMCQVIHSSVGYVYKALTRDGSGSAEVSTS